MKFMETFRNENKGKYNAGDMMKLGAGAYRKLKNMSNKYAIRQQKIIALEEKENCDDEGNFNYVSHMRNSIDEAIPIKRNLSYDKKNTTKSRKF